MASISQSNSGYLSGNSSPRSISPSSDEELPSHAISPNSSSESLLSNDSAEALEHNSENAIHVTSNEKKVIEWIRAHPGQSFVFDGEDKISLYDYPLSLSRQDSEDELEREWPVDAIHESTYDEENTFDRHFDERLLLRWNSEERSSYQRRRRNMSPGEFSAVAGNRVVIDRRRGTRTQAFHGEARFRHTSRGGSNSRHHSPTSHWEGDMTSTSVAGASVLYGASNFIIRGGSIAPGAFTAIAGNQEIWVD
ncbi:hypothetical protein EV361DRAFT_900519 [Lentinula raphanica]|uniref:Uncharacterized protein n=1 Tax=Lentinula raphanica TaxID=153919 RepID=A0AA38U6V4_9AGAR|nr:hypothetical protein F5878DRAFT_633172 [Lentinula raphanica]KAJ3973368.1 hypothetical protein EV361DRAFT_900519 [Lentinula raphanica]